MDEHRAGTDGHGQVALLGLYRSSGHTDHQCFDDLYRCSHRGMPITGSPLLCQCDSSDPLCLRD
ncbi:unnamed protein product, partial [Staurois parvus]